MKVIPIKLGEVDYPMCMSLTAVERIEEEFGGLEQLMESLTYTNAGGLTNVIRAAETVLGIFLDAGRTYATARGETVPPLPDCRLTDLLGVDEMNFSGLVNEVIGASTTREVEAEPPKKEEATAEVPAEAVRGFDSPQPEPD